MAERREDYKIVEIKKRKFKVEKFTAQVGSFILFTLMEKFLPMALESKVGISGSLPQGRQSMTKDEFWQLQKDCLSIVSEVLPAGSRPVIAENGLWGVMNIEKDPALVILLTIHALEFNIKDFFTEENLSALKEVIAAIRPAIMPMSTGSPTHQ